MERTKNREWVKNAAIIFLAVLLVLTFFSNTIMNRSLPEVATQSVTSGSIVARVRGSGTVTANGAHQVKAEGTRQIQSVLVKVGQKVEAGDVLFTLGEGASEEIEAAEKNLRTLQASYNRTAANGPIVAFGYDNLRLQHAKEEMDNAELAMNAAKEALDKVSPYLEQIARAEDQANAARIRFEQLDEERQSLQRTLQAAQNAVNNDGALSVIISKMAAVQDASQVIYSLTTEISGLESDIAYLEYIIPIHEAEGQDVTQEKDELEKKKALLLTKQEELKTAQDKYASEGIDPENPAQLAQLQTEYNSNTNVVALTAAQAAMDAFDVTEYDYAYQMMEEWQTTLERLRMNGGTAESAAYQQAVEAYKKAQDNYYSIYQSIAVQVATTAQQQNIQAIELQSLNEEIEAAKKKLADLMGGENSQVTAKVAGTILTIDATAGDTKQKGDILCSIEVPDMGYSLSFSVTNDQANRLRPGDSATVSNFYWGSEIVATLNSIKIDPKNPQTNKLLTFDLTGNVTAGSELTISVGQKSANYDLIIPSSAIRSDSNGSFVLRVDAKNSPLGNRYIARRVPVEVLASDDSNSAVTADLGNGDYVITTSSAPVKSGEMVRLATS